MTELEYLENTYKFSSEAKVVQVLNTEKGIAIILDRTIFYPQGGGQPADRGKIYSDEGTFIISDVRLDENSVVHHFGVFESGSFATDGIVQLEIDPKRRQLNARLHSAGHLIDIAANKAGFPIKAVKGYHFSDGPFVEYEGTIENPQEYVARIEEIANKLVLENLPLNKKCLSPEEARDKNIRAPEGKSARVVNFEGYEEICCGGTHVESSSEIGKIIIRKISSKKGNSKIAYELI